MVLAVGDQNNRAALLALGAEAARSGHQRICGSGTLDGNGAGLNAVKEGFGRYVVGGDGELHEALSRKDYQTYAVAGQLVHQPGNGQFGPLQTVGGIVLRQHRIGDVQRNHYLDSAGLPLLQAGAQLGTRQTQHKEQECQREECHLEPPLGVRHVGHQLVHQILVAKAGGAAPLCA